MNKKFFLILFLCSFIIPLRAEDFYDGTVGSSAIEEEDFPKSSSDRNPAPLVENKDISDDQEEDRLSQLENQVRDLRGKLEELRHAVKMISQRAPDSSNEELKPKSFDHEKGKKHSRGPRDSSSEDSADEGSTLKAGPALQRYEEAQEFLAQQAYPEAERALKDIIHHYPSDPLVVNAQYWLGETYYVQKDYARAAVAFGDAYKAYRKLDKSNDARDKEARKISFAKAPEALVKLCLSLKALGKNDQACITLDQLRSEFPRLPQNVKKLAEMAEQSLQQCKKAEKD